MTYSAYQKQTAWVQALKANWINFFSKRSLNVFLFVILTSMGTCVTNFCRAQDAGTKASALVKGQWFVGGRFESGTFYSVNGIFTRKKPKRIDTTINLEGLFIIPPFAEAHNHNIGTGVETWERKAINAYLQAGVFYVKIQGNLPMHDSIKNKLRLNSKTGLDVSFAQANITASDGHPSFLVNQILLPQGYFPGYTKESLKDYRYFVIDSEADIKQKWPVILRLKPDFIKIILSYSNQYAKRRLDTTTGLSKGLDPALLPLLVRQAHGVGLRISAHVSNVADFSNAVAAGIDEIAHLPIDTIPISIEDAKRAANQNITVVTTCIIAQRLPTSILPKAALPQVLDMYKESMKRLRNAGVKLAVGSDDVRGTSVEEAMYLHAMRAVDDTALLNMWTEITPQTIFPKRKIGLLQEGYEASFLALEGNPLEDFSNVKKIKLRIKQGHSL